MISAEELKVKAERLYPGYLSSLITLDTFFPKVIRANKLPKEKTFDSLHHDLVSLLQNSKDKIGYGYKVILKKVKSPRYGEQDLPEDILFETEEDFVKFLRKENEATSFKSDLESILNSFPSLSSFFNRYPLRITEHRGDWEDLLKVCHYFVNNPKPNLFIRELPIQVNTKFVEKKKSILDEMLSILIPYHINQKGKTFEERFHLKQYEPYIHLRILDSDIANSQFSGLSDIGCTPKELSRINISCSRVFILENKQSFKNIDVFLTLPQMKGTIALFGSGFKVGSLKEIHWLREKEIFYWGDIDVHGFQILSQLRSYLPNVRSFLMDMETFESLKDERGKGTLSDLKEVSLPHLTIDETTIYKYLLSLGENKSRLEQEKIPQEYVIKAVKRVFFKISN